MREEWPPREVRVCAPGWIALATHHEPTALANARLIAAAPDLLAERDRLAETVAELVEALETTLSVYVLTALYDRDRSRDVSEEEHVIAARAALAKAREQA